MCILWGKDKPGLTDAKVKEGLFFCCPCVNLQQVAWGKSWSAATMLHYGPNIYVLFILDSEYLFRFIFSCAYWKQPKMNMQYSCKYLSWPNAWHTVGQIPKKCKETSNLMWLLLIWFILGVFACWNLFCTIASLRIKCDSNINHFRFVLQKSQSKPSTQLRNLILRFLYIIGCSGPPCGMPET